MEFLVNGKKFDNIEEATKYEEELELESKKKEDELNKYIKYLKSKLQVYEVGSKYIAVVVNSDHKKYVSAIASKFLGSQYKIVNKEVKEMWSMTKVTDKDIIDKVVDLLMNRGTSNDKVVLFVGNDIDKFVIEDKVEGDKEEPVLRDFLDIFDMFFRY